LNIDFEEKTEWKEKSESTGSSISLFAYFSSGNIISASALGAKGKPAITVGKEAAEHLLKELSAKKPVDSHLADQLIPFMALAQGYSTIECTALTEHALNNIRVCELLLGCKFDVKGALNESAEIFVQGIGFKA
jgi:RNA 3'-terminal phosphate cyclase